MKTLTKILVPALALGGLAYVAYEHHEHKRYHANAITIQSLDDDSQGKNAEQDGLTPKELLGMKHRFDNPEPKTDRNGNYRDMNELYSDLVKDMHKSEGVKQNASSVASNASESMSKSGNLDHLFVPKSLNSKQESSLDSITHDLSSVVAKAKSQGLASQTMKSKATSKGDK